MPLLYAGQIARRDDQTTNEVETYTLNEFEGDRRRGQVRKVKAGGGEGGSLKPIHDVGEKTDPAREASAIARVYDVRIPRCKGESRVFVGQRAEAFVVSVRGIFDLVNLVPLEGDSAHGAGGGFPGGITQDGMNDDLVGKKNVTPIALEVPISSLNGNGVIGAWQTASLPRNRDSDLTPSYNEVSETSGRLVRRSRVSAPPVNEVMIKLPTSTASTPPGHAKAQGTPPTSPT